MLTDYIRAAMEKARYEILEDDGTYYGEIPGFQGVWANEKTLIACQQELQSVLEDWVLLGLQRGGRRGGGDWGGGARAGPLLWARSAAPGGGHRPAGERGQPGGVGEGRLSSGGAAAALPGRRRGVA